MGLDAPKAEVKIGDWVSRGFELYKSNIGTMIAAGAIAMVLSAVTMGILGGPMMAGLIMIVLATLRKQEPKPGAGDVFKGFEVFANAFLFVLVFFLVGLVLNVIPLLGQLLYVVYSLGVGTLVMFGLFLIADRRMAFWPAAMASIEKVKPNFWPFLGLYVVSCIIGSLGMILCGIGVLITIPIHFCIMSVAYSEVFAPGAETASCVPGT